jgi:hypothetical protein
MLDLIICILTVALAQAAHYTYIMCKPVLDFTLQPKRPKPEDYYSRLN